MSATRIYPQHRIGGPEDFVQAGIDNEVLVVEMVGASTIGQLRDVIVQGLRAGWLSNTAPILVDLSVFTGTINWDDVRDLSHLPEWGHREGPANPVAYVSGDTLFSMIIKLVEVFLPHSTHRAFTSREWADAWLRSQAGMASRETALH